MTIRLVARLVAIAALALGAWSTAARADTAQATCEVRQHGEEKSHASGPCEFSQRQGYVSIALRNGKRIELSPTDKPHHFKDADGDKVVFEKHGDASAYKWDGGQRILVTFGAAAPAASAEDRSADASGRAGAGNFDATGQVPCAQAKGQPMGQCSFGVARAGGGTATVVVTRPDGRKRSLFFENGKALSADTSQADGYGEFRAHKEADLFRIQVGDERYEIPEAVITGG